MISIYLIYTYVCKLDDDVFCVIIKYISRIVSTTHMQSQNWYICVFNYNLRKFEKTIS